jgi:hypothetical protein
LCGFQTAEGLERFEELGAATEPGAGGRGAPTGRGRPAKQSAAMPKKAAKAAGRTPPGKRGAPSPSQSPSMPRQQTLKDLKPLPPKRNLCKAMFKNLCEEALKKEEKTMYARCVRATLWVRVRAVLLALVLTFWCGVPLSDIFRIIKDDDALEKQFKSWDTDGSGCIDRKELKEALQKLGYRHTGNACCLPRVRRHAGQPRSHAS